MKKLLLLLVALSMSVSLWAQYASMEFTTVDGSKYKIGAMGLVIKAEGENLVVSQGTNTLTLKLTSVVSMQLTDYMASAEEIESHSDGPTEVYTLEGIKVGEFETIDKARASLQPGLYILKDKSGRTIKIYIEQ